jgi:hypothetical protein
MTINNWLCRNFDKPTGYYDDSTLDNPHPIEPKGYVTIMDVVASDKVTLPFFGLIVFFILGVMGNVVMNNFTTNSGEEPTVLGFFIWIFEGYLIWSIVAGFIGLLYLLYKLSQIKIAKCEPKEKEDE